jgi:dTDP-4-dehydrorhamnose reductase
LLFGSSGQLGGELSRAFGATMEIEAPDLAQVDMSREDTVRQAINAFQPHWIINAAAFTAVDRAEAEPADATAINADAVRAIGEEAMEAGAAVIHYSTDYVFDGSLNRPYLETDPVHPLNAYGRSKLGGEIALEQSGAAYVLFRISWLYGATGANFLRTILRLARQNADGQTPVRIVNDQHGIPTWTRDVAESTRKVVERISAEAESKGCPLVEAAQAYKGIYHLSGYGETTWFGFAAEALMQLQVIMPDVRFARLQPVSTSEYSTPARRPRNSRLNSSKIAEVFDIRLPDWQESLTQVLEEMAAQGEQGLG